MRSGDSGTGLQVPDCQGSTDALNLLKTYPSGLRGSVSPRGGSYLIVKWKVTM